MKHHYEMINNVGWTMFWILMASMLVSFVRI